MISTLASTAIPMVSTNPAMPGRVSAAWRPLVWDPFYTSPEEHLAYVGLVPLLLAVRAIVRGRRGDPAMRA